MSLTLASPLSLGMRVSRRGMASKFGQAWRQICNMCSSGFCYEGIRLLVFFWSACLSNSPFCFVGRRIMYISIPRDVHEDDAHIYLHIHVSRKRGNLIVNLVDIVTSHSLWNWKFVPADGGRFNAGCQRLYSALLLQARL